MNEYRAYVIGNDDHELKSISWVCESDADAIELAGRLLDGHNTELWSGVRFVVRLNHEVTRES